MYSVQTSKVFCVLKRMTLISGLRLLCIANLAGEHGLPGTAASTTLRWELAWVPLLQASLSLKSLEIPIGVDRRTGAGEGGGVHCSSSSCSPSRPCFPSSMGIQTACLNQFTWTMHALLHTRLSRYSFIIHLTVPNLLKGHASKRTVCGSYCGSTEPKKQEAGLTFVILQVHVCQK